MVVQILHFKCDKCGKEATSAQLWDADQSALNLKCECGGTFKELPHHWIEKFIMQ